MDMVSETDADAATMQSNSNVNPTYASRCCCRIIEYAFIGRRTQQPHTLPALRRGFERAFCIDGVLDTIKRLGNPICSGLASNRLVMGG